MENNNLQNQNEHTSVCRFILKIFAFIGSTLTFIRNFISNIIMLAIIVLAVIAYNLAGSIKEKAVTIASGEEAISVQEQQASILYLPLSGTIVEAPFAQSEFSNLQRRINEQVTGSVSHELLAIERALEIASTDNSLKLVIVDLNNSAPMNMAMIKRIGVDLDKVKASGKKIVALAYSFSQSAYAVAAHADKILLDPMGQVNLRGIGMSTLYYNELLTKLKVTPYIFRAGHFKSAVEPYERNSMSPDVKAEYADLVSSLWASYVQELNVRKVLSRTEVLPKASDYVKSLELYGGDIATMQLENNLVDELLSREDYFASLTKDYGSMKDDSDKPNMINYRRYLSLKDTGTPLKDNQIAVVYGIGQITSQGNDVYAFTPDNVNPILSKLKNNDAIKAVVLYVNSPGGSVKASEDIRRAILRLKAAGKKVVVSMNGTAASGGYWISSAADKIVADDATLTGSIGVFSVALGAHNLLNDWGITQDGVTSHEFAENALAKPLSANNQETLRLSVAHTYKTFIDIVAKARRLNPENYFSYAEGQVFLGEDALNLGLIDKLGSLQDAIAEAAKLINQDESNVSVLHMSPEADDAISPLELLMLTTAQDLIPDVFLKDLIDLMQLNQNIKVTDEPAVMALSPFYLNF